MKVYIQQQSLPSIAMKRVADALVRYAPGECIEWVDDMYLADLVILHVIGYPETVQQVEALQRLGKQYAIIQYCMRSTQRPDTNDWKTLWEDAALVWSYYDLVDLTSQDGMDFSHVKFYHSPLGVDSSVFKPWQRSRKYYTVCTSGYVAESESVREAADACAGLKKVMFHLGPPFPWFGSHVTARKGMNDSDLSRIFSDCFYVSGLRRAEGFELPAAEGLLCGARPIMYDRPHYRQWFDDFAVFIPEDTPEKVTANLAEIFRSDYRPVREEERLRAAEWFNWEPIVKGFWERVL